MPAARAPGGRVRRFVLAIVGTVLLAAAVAVVLRLLGASEHNVVAGVAGLVFASVIWLPVTRRWSARAHLCWASSIFLFVVYLTYALEWTFASHLGAASTAGGLLLWVLEVFAAALCCAYLWEICDALGTEHWRRRITPTTRLGSPDSELPMISLHVPAHNEPPDMVIDTLRSLLRLDYPRYEIILIDDNTDDEQLWRPVEAWCERHGVKFAHLENWPGYKSGALNYALRRLTYAGAELIGVVDSDYQIEPRIPAPLRPAFADPLDRLRPGPAGLPRLDRIAPYYRRLYYSYKYFFSVSQPSRNEHDGAIFAGTMGLIRRVALDELGGWNEWCITEDAELSLRLLPAGWSRPARGPVLGLGIMPLTFEALKGQRYRWCFGGIQILRMHWRSMMPGRRRQNRMTVGQRWAYLAGALQWYGDLLGLLFLIFLLAGAINLATGGGQLFRKLTVFLVAAVPVLVCSAWCARSPCCAAAPVRPGGMRSARSSSGSPPRSWSPGLRCLPCSPRRPRSCARRRPASGPLVGGAAHQLGGVHPRVVRLPGNRRRPDQDEPAQRPAAGRPAAVPHARHGRRPGQQLGRPPCRPAAGPARAAQHRVPP